MNINLISPINSLSYGVVGFNILKSLYKLQNKISLFALGNIDGTIILTQEEANIINESINNAKFYDSSATSIRLYHQFGLDLFPGKGKRIGFPIFELDGFNEQEIHHLKNVDEIFVCSKWAGDILQNFGIKSKIVPLGVDMNRFYYTERGRKNDNFIFFNIGKWEIRKGHDLLLEAFNSAFDIRDNVELWMVNYNPFIGAKNDEWRNMYMSSKMKNKIRFFDRINTQNELNDLYNNVDCGIFPARAEGWNLGLLEMMACGKQVIATDYSGHTEFINDENCIKIPIAGVEPAFDGIWFHGNANWSTVLVSDIVDRMRFAHRRWKIINHAGIETAKKYSWDNTAKLIIENL